MRHTSIGKGKNNPLRIFHLPILQQDADGRVQSQKPLTNNLILTPVPWGTHRPQTPFLLGLALFSGYPNAQAISQSHCLTPPMHFFKHPSLITWVYFNWISQKTIKQKVCDWDVIRNMHQYRLMTDRYIIYWNTLGNKSPLYLTQG